MIVPKHQRMSADIEQSIIGLYATSMSNKRHQQPDEGHLWRGGQPQYRFGRYEQTLE
ncbi:MAG: hypothetical protein MUF71_02300 [Candidatus Kapabacteria bacterium]|jgi:hypothetical protein|nr:hypothetical protein [Candidatus Kapabacteria bacterium]